MFFRRNHNADGIEITSYERRDHYEVRELLFRNYRSHTHLDWHESDQWLEDADSPVKLAWQSNHLVGLIGTSIPNDGNVWIRIIAILDDVDAAPIINALWEALCADLGALQVRRIAVLMLRDWLAEVFKPLGFAEEDWIVTLRRELPEPPPENVLTNLHIRAAEPSDLATLTEIDHLAFGTLWQMSAAEIRQAMRVAASSTVAMLDTTPVGYQISTMYFDGSHLARLAVKPDNQARGIGRALVSDVLRRFARRNVHSMTVNTQLSNTRSQHLYEHLGFARNGYDIAVWMTDL